MTRARSGSLLRSCWPRRGGKEAEGEPVLLKAVDPTTNTGNRSETSSNESSSRRMTARPRRRVAVAAENTEELAKARWKAALDAVSSKETKSPELILKLMTALKAHDIFGKMDEKLLGEIIDALRTTSAQTQEEIIKQGDLGDAFYLVAEGELAAFIGDSGQPVTTYGTGGSFGELALMYDAPRAATVKVTSAEGAKLYKLGRIMFRNLVSKAFMEANSGLEKKLANVPLLAGLSEEQIKQIAEVMETVEFTGGEYITEMGLAADSLYLILSGEVACHKAGETELRLMEGSVFGESCLSAAGDPKREANVVAVGVVKCARLMAADCSAVIGPLAEALERTFCKKVINSIDIFNKLAPQDRARLFSELTVKSVPSGATVIEEGSTNDTFYIIKHGSVDVLKSDGAKLATKTSGGYFGERSILTAEPAVATVVATAETELMMLSKATFEKILGPMQVLLDRIAEQDKEREKMGGVAWSDLDVRMVLGEGSFGSVRLAIHKPTKTAYALKALHKGHLISTNQINNTVNEKRIMMKCKHPLILSCLGSYNSPTHVSLLLTLAQGGELFTRISKVGVFKPAEASLYCAMVTSALGFLSARSIAHRDLKLENLLFGADGYLMLVDFGFAKEITDKTWTFCGTPDYLAPEILAHKGHNWAVDWWTLGILTYEMLHGEPPFASHDQMETFQKIQRGTYRMGSRVPADAKDLIERLLVHNPAKRLGMLAGAENDLFKHPFCAHIDVNAMLQKKIKPPFVPKLSDPTDTSNFDSYPEPAPNKKYEKYLDAKYDEMWEKEFG